MPRHALTSAEISLPQTARPAGVARRLALLAPHFDLVGLTDNHAGQARMSPLAAVALAREQGVRTVVHVSCRDRNRLALQAQVVGAAALGCNGVCCVYGDPVPGVQRASDMKVAELIALVRPWSAPMDVTPGCVVNPFASDPAKERDLLRRKVEAGAEFLQTQMVFDVPALVRFLEQNADLLKGKRVFASVGITTDRRNGRPFHRAPWRAVAGGGAPAGTGWGRRRYGRGTRRGLGSRVGR